MQVAFKNNQTGIHYITDKVPLSAVMLENGGMEASQFPPAWQGLPPSAETTQQYSGALPALSQSRLSLTAAALRGHQAL